MTTYTLGQTSVDLNAYLNATYPNYAAMIAATQSTLPNTTLGNQISAGLTTTNPLQGIFAASTDSAKRVAFGANMLDIGLAGSAAALHYYSEKTAIYAAMLQSELVVTPTTVYNAINAIETNVSATSYNLGTAAKYMGPFAMAAAVGFAAYQIYNAAPADRNDVGLKVTISTAASVIAATLTEAGIIAALGVGVVASSAALGVAVAVGASLAGIMVGSLIEDNWSSIKNAVEDGISNSLTLAETIEDAQTQFGGLLADWFDATGTAATDQLSAASSWLDQQVAQIPGIIDGVLTPIQDVDQWVTSISQSFNEAATTPPVSPLVLDLDGDGVELTSLTDSGAAPVYWDIDNDGFREASAWVKADDGLLVRDVNSNGVIDNHSELFGTAEIDGFTILSALDDYYDNKITSADSAWSSLKVWRDLNQDGVSQSNELSSLSALNITEISLNANYTNYEIAGNPVIRDSTYKLANGTTRTVVDALFKFDNVNAVYAGDYTLDPDTLPLPQLRGYGVMADLSIAMSLKSTLLDAVEDFTSLDIATDPSLVTNAIEQIMYLWADVEDVAPGDRGGSGSNYNGQKISFMEKFLDHPAGDYPGWNPTSTKGQNQESVFNQVYKHIAARLLIQSNGAEFLSRIPSYNPITDTFFGDATLDTTAISNALSGQSTTDKILILSTIVTMLDGSVGVDNLDGTTISSLNSYITGADPNGLLNLDSLRDWLPSLVSGVATVSIYNGTASADSVVASVPTGVSDIIYGLDGDDYLEGGDGNDIIFGGNGNDTLRGGIGINKLYGGDGDDIFTYLDSGVMPVGEVIDGGAGNNEIDAFANLSNATITNIQTLKFNYATYPGVVMTAEQLNGFTSLIGLNGMQVLVYAAKGGTYDLGSKAGSYMVGINGSAENDVLIGDGNDQLLQGNNGDDTLQGLGGADSLLGGNGNDTFLVGGSDFASGETIDGSSGSDTLITTGGNLSLASIYSVETMQISGSDATLSSSQLSDFTTLENSYSGPVTLTASAAGTYSLAGKTVTGVFNLTGTSGDDTFTGNNVAQTLTGNGGSDILDGAGGGDSLIGGTGDDIYKLNLGYGGSNQITENDSTSGNTDTLQIGSGVDRDQLWFTHSGNDLLVRVIGTSDAMTIKDWYSGSANQVEQIKTSANDVLTNTNVQNLVNAMASLTFPTTTTLSPSDHTALDSTIAANWA